PPRDKPREDRYHQSSGAENYHSDDHSKGGPGGGGGERERTGSHRNHDNYHKSDRERGDGGYDKRRQSGSGVRFRGGGGGRRGGPHINGTFQQRSRSQTDKHDDYPAEIQYYVDFNPVDVSGLAVGVPVVPPIVPIFPFPTAFMGMDADRLKESVKQQIEYYFSEENLQRDFFLRRKMDGQGFLPISLIASFHRVQALTQDVQMVIDSLAESTLVEVVDSVKLRAKKDPEKWPLTDNLSAAGAGLHANVPSFIPGQPYGYSYGE
ncbi:unnamed protein product, partial [Oppiella nova]